MGFHNRNLFLVNECKDINKYRNVNQTWNIYLRQGGGGCDTATCTQKFSVLFIHFAKSRGPDHSDPLYVDPHTLNRSLMSISSIEKY